MALRVLLMIVAASHVTAIPILQGNMYTNPVINSNHPDPGVLIHEGTIFAATTSGDAPDAFPIMADYATSQVSKDMVNWQLAAYVFPSNSSTRPVWAVSDFWAPEIHKISENQFNVYFAARHNDGTLCVGVAVASNPLGPYSDIGSPLVYTPGMGNIDASFFRDGDSDYLIWKRDGNGAVPPVPTPIFVQQIVNNGRSRTGKAYVAITNDQPWEDMLVEGPWIVHTGNGFTSPNYAIGVGRSSNITGPYEKFSANPILRHDADTIDPTQFTGPGHCSVVQTTLAKRWYIVYHAWHNGKVGGSNPRVMNVDEVVFDGSGWPAMADNRTTPTHTPQPFPRM
eukprot:gene4388-8525_t